MKQEIWEDGEPGVPHSPSTFYPFQVNAESHIILPNELPFLPSTEKAAHFNFFFHNVHYHLTSPHIQCNGIIVKYPCIFLTLNVTKTN